MLNWCASGERHFVSWSQIWQLSQTWTFIQRQFNWFEVSICESMNRIDDTDSTTHEHGLFRSSAIIRCLSIIMLRCRMTNNLSFSMYFFYVWSDRLLFMILGCITPAHPHDSITKSNSTMCHFFWIKMIHHCIVCTYYSTCVRVTCSLTVNFISETKVRERAQLISQVLVSKENFRYSMPIWSDVLLDWVGTATTLIVFTVIVLQRVCKRVVE